MSTPEVADCLFCRIVAGDLPSEEVLSTEQTYAFRDLIPRAPTHVLIVPRHHITDAAALEKSHGEILAEMFHTAQQVAELEGLERGYRLVFNVGEDSGNSVPHLHLHVIGGRLMGWPPG
ncbi:MAG: histidine triad nucleotide-binding protein [Acidimicrobiales bacterium]